MGSYYIQLVDDVESYIPQSQRENDYSPQTNNSDNEYIPQSQKRN